jgi:hypothetical protein
MDDSAMLSTISLDISQHENAIISKLFGLRDALLLKWATEYKRGKQKAIFIH